MTQRRARQIAYSAAASLCEAELGNPSDLIYEILASNGYSVDDYAIVAAELADIARRLAHNGRAVNP